MVLQQISVYPLQIPMRTRFRHAAATRSVAEPLVIAVELRGGIRGYGETHPRDYVSGESADRAAEVIQTVLLPHLLDMRPDSFPAALECLAEMPETDRAGRPVSAIRAALELALLDAWSRAFERSLDHVAGWLGSAGFGAPGSLPRVCYSGVVSAESPASVRRALFKMRLIGLRDFKIKVGDPQDDPRLRAAVEYLGRGLRGGKFTLRVDANGSWTPEQAARRLHDWRELPIVSVEQPLPRGSEAALAPLARSTRFPLMADESLVTQAEARRLIADGGVRAFNIRIGKNGGLIPSLRMAASAQQAGLFVQMGCLVGETSILSAAGRWFLQLTPGVRFAEGSYGRFLLAGDVVTRPLQFGWRGRARPMDGYGLGVEVNAELLARHCHAPVQTMRL